MNHISRLFQEFQLIPSSWPCPVVGDWLRDAGCDDDVLCVAIETGIWFPGDGYENGLMLRYSYGCGYASGTGYGDGSGHGAGGGSGHGIGDGSGDGFISCDQGGNVRMSAYSDGVCFGSGFGFGNGSGCGDGSGYGSGDGSGFGDGSGDGSG